MTTYRETVKFLLFNHPLLFSNKLAVNSQLFAVIGNGFEWTEEGTLEQDYRDPREKISDSMSYEDLNETYHNLDAFGAAEIESIRIMRQFTEKHVDLLLDASCSCNFFSNSAGNYKLLTYMKPNQVSYEYASIFNYPPNVQKDWGTGMEDFVRVWLVALNFEFGLGSKGSIEHWPADARKLRARLLVVQEDLNFKITGKTTTERNAILDKIIADL